MKILFKMLSDYGKFNYEQIKESIPEPNEESRYVVYYGSLMEPSTTTKTNKTMHYSKFEKPITL
ncbi:hypothetical protein [Bacillus mesophilum]|uniref:Alpha-carbonic anhydrase domain-containing protein n=1 Tax=Bacillus mesophilum TaxID=1071718 RepID=A0A7V7UV68_9BACI|nr:hypothetical protein [Bacillus mesophilum]KAB2331948.1 hypothetical protein F7732_14910 [Bacillus mesophilum]